MKARQIRVGRDRADPAFEGPACEPVPSLSRLRLLDAVSLVIPRLGLGDEKLRLPSSIRSIAKVNCTSGASFCGRACQAPSNLMRQ